MDPDPIQLPNPTPFFCDFKDAKKFFSIFFSYNLPAGTLSSVLKFNVLLKFCVLKYYFASIILVRSTPLWEKKDPEPDSDSYLWIMDPDPEGPKTYPQHWFWFMTLRICSKNL